MSQYIISVIRTWVPVFVGSLIGWLVSIGIDVPEDARNSLIIAISGVTIAAYYALVRWLEQKFPQVGLLLGYVKQPVYIDPTKTPQDQGDLYGAVTRITGPETTVSGNEKYPLH